MHPNSSIRSKDIDTHNQAHSSRNVEKQWENHENHENRKRKATRHIQLNYPNPKDGTMTVL